MNTEPHFLHGCPECPVSRGPEDIYNAGKGHRAACHTHKTTWFLGSNLFSSWRYETEQGQRDRYREIEDYASFDRVLADPPEDVLSGWSPTTRITGAPRIDGAD